AQTISQFRLDRQPFDDLLDAFRQDQHQRRYETIDELIHYCQRSANPVGRIVLRMGSADDDETNLALSDQICTGLQLANFWQDVARDYAIGRIYVPRSELRAFGITESQLGCMAKHRSTTPALRRLLEHQCHQTEALFHRGMPLCERVPAWLGRSVRLFAHGGLATLDALRAIDFDVMRTRPRVRKATQARLVLRALLAHR
ncbi:MAG: squalene/phytoene synthase family protein, partial [Novipirellula sp. JB048]